MRPVRLGAEWAWTSIRPDGQGVLGATYPTHPNTGKTRIQFDEPAGIWGWRFNTTVRPFTHEILFGLVLRGPDGVDEFLAAWPHHAWEPGGATRVHEPPFSFRTPITVPAGSLLWVWVDGWGQQYGAAGAHATVAEFQASIFVDGAVTILGDWGSSPLLPGAPPVRPGLLSRAKDWLAGKA